MHIDKVESFPPRKFHLKIRSPATCAKMTNESLNSSDMIYFAIFENFSEYMNDIFAQVIA